VSAAAWGIPDAGGRGFHGAAAPAKSRSFRRSRFCMAIYHLSTKPVSRGQGRSSTAAAAYRAGDRVLDLTTDQTFDYTRKRGIEHAEIVLPTVAAQRDINWARDRQALWNAAERAEKRKDARVAREYEVALPYELTKGQRVALVRAFAWELANRYGVAVDFALHRPHRAGDERNYHAHILTTTRQVEPTGLGAKASIEWSDQDRARKGLGPAKKEVVALRERWGALTNEHLRERGLQIRVDHRTLEAQGIERAPTTHLGPAVWAMERRGIETEVGLRVREQHAQEAQRRLERAAELGRLEREAHEMESSILDLSSDLQAALRARGQEQDFLHQARQEGREALADLRRRAMEEKQLLEDLSLKRAKELEHEREEERQRTHERDGPELEP
jgi:ATP-dependent exoDNAse (exonuclease V) alpha subunit